MMEERCEQQTVSYNILIHVDNVKRTLLSIRGTYGHFYTSVWNSFSFLSFAFFKTFLAHGLSYIHCQHFTSLNRMQEANLSQTILYASIIFELIYHKIYRQVRTSVPTPFGKCANKKHTIECLLFPTFPRSLMNEWIVLCKQK